MRGIVLFCSLCLAACPSWAQVSAQTGQSPDLDHLLPKQREPPDLDPPPRGVVSKPQETPGVKPPSNESTANKLMDRYRTVGEQQNHKFGEGGPGSLPPNFNLKPLPKPAAPPVQPKPDGIPEQR